MLYNELDIPDSLEYLAWIVRFLGEASTGARELELSELALAGAGFVFESLEKELLNLRERYLAEGSLRRVV